MGERSNLVATQLLAKHDLAVRVHAVHLEHVLGQIEADCRNLHGGRSFRYKWLLTLPLWHVDALIGWGVHPIAYIAATPVVQFGETQRVAVLARRGNR